jgi:chaperonin GroES
MATTITPLGRRVLVKRSTSEEKTAGGIFLPDTAKEKPQEAVIIALGTGKDDEGKNVADLFTVKAGDTILISKYGGTEVKIDGEDHLIINETDILGIITK